MSKAEKIPFSKVRENFSMIQVKWLSNGTTSYNFFLVPQSKEGTYIKNPGLVRQALEAVGFYTVPVDLYNKDPHSYGAEIDEAFDGCVMQCMGQYGFFPENVDFG